jgi:WHG domain-containing protein
MELKSKYKVISGAPPEIEQMLNLLSQDGWHPVTMASLALPSVIAADGFAELAVLREEARAKVGSDPWKRLSAGGKEYVRFAEERPRLFDLMFGPLGVGSERYKAQAPAPSDRKAYQQLSEALDKLVLDGRITAQRRAGAESVLWPMIHGLAVLRRVGALPESLNVSWKRMQKFTADALGLDLDE